LNVRLSLNNWSNLMASTTYTVHLLDSERVSWLKRWIAQ